MLASLILLAFALPPPDLPYSPIDLTDIERFPPPAVVASQLELSALHLNALDSWIIECRPHQRDQIIEWRWDAVCCRAPWLTLEQAHRCAEMGNGVGVVASLRELRHLLGAAAYDAGSLPHPLPLWRYRRMD